MVTFLFNLVIVLLKLIVNNPYVEEICTPIFVPLLPDFNFL